MQCIDFNTNDLFHEIGWLQDDDELKQLVNTCIARLRTVLSKCQPSFTPNPNASWQVSEKALEDLLSSRQEVSDIRTNTDISNCLVFHTANLEGSVIDEEAIRLRQAVDTAWP